MTRRPFSILVLLVAAVTAVSLVTGATGSVPAAAAPGDSTTTVPPSSTLPATTVSPTTVSPTTVPPTTVSPTTVSPTTVSPTTVVETTIATTTTTTLPPNPIGLFVAQVTSKAKRIVRTPIDVVSIYNSGELKSDVESKSIAAAQQAGANFAIRGAASIGMIELRRDNIVVQRPEAGFAIPMGTTVLPLVAVTALMGESVSAALDENRIVMSSLTASLRDARAGDVVTLVAANGAGVAFTIGAIVPDDITGGTELLMTPEAANRIQLERKSGVVMWNIPSRAAIDQAMSDQNVVSTRIRIRRSWDPADPDSTLGMGSSKALLGEFAYRLTTQADGSTGVLISENWKAQNLPSGRRLLDGGVRIIARCHNVIEPALRAALAEVTASGLGGTINVNDANRAGGCYNPRFNRLDQDSEIGFLSRHTWAMAIDTNTIGSCQGCAPPDMDCRTVRIFRKHGFAWGGNFLTPDGMHYEFVGERRDELPYPSRYCRNISSPKPQGSSLDDSETPFAFTERPTIFADAGLSAEG